MFLFINIIYEFGLPSSIAKEYSTVCVRISRLSNQYFTSVTVVTVTPCYDLFCFLFQCFPVKRLK